MTPLSTDSWVGECRAPRNGFRTGPYANWVEFAFNRIGVTTDLIFILARFPGKIVPGRLSGNAVTLIGPVAKIQTLAAGGTKGPMGVIRTPGNGLFALGALEHNIIGHDAMLSVMTFRSWSLQAPARGIFDARP